VTLKDAKALRDYIHSKNSINCTVPLGHGPDNYFPRSIMRDGPRDWKSRAQFRLWHALHIRERRRIERDYKRVMNGQSQRRRSPIELMIDRACGLG
jgi:hypothetical protein